MAAEHYPATPRLGDVISEWDVPDVADTKVFHAGTKLEGADPDMQHVVTAGGRVLCVCALGDSVADAQRKAYAEVAGISWHGEFHRHDIGWRAIERENATRA
jgi:phosphoribosylamine--glycine ligase